MKLFQKLRCLIGRHVWHYFETESSPAYSLRVGEVDTRSRRICEVCRKFQYQTQYTGEDADLIGYPKYWNTDKK